MFFKDRTPILPPALPVVPAVETLPDTGVRVELDDPAQPKGPSEAETRRAAKGKDKMSVEEVPGSPLVPGESDSDPEEIGRRGELSCEGTPSEGGALPIDRMAGSPPHRVVGEASASSAKDVAMAPTRPAPRDSLAETLAPLRHYFFRVDDVGVHHSAILRGDDIMEESVQRGIGGVRLPEVMLRPLIELPREDLRAMIDQSRGLVSLFLSSFL